MTIMDSEHIAAAELLYKLCDRMREELQRHTHPTIRGTLMHSIDYLDAAASQTARGVLTLEASDAIAEAGELTLRKVIGLRKMRENVWPPNWTSGRES
jgi:hypothetical protein